MIGPWRTGFQWLTTALIIGVPFLTVDGHSLLRLDFTSLSLHAFGQRFPITDLPLFLLLTIALVLTFLLMTLAFGRAWCGWACPQTTLVDLVEWTARRLGIKVRAGRMQANLWQAAALQLLYLALALLVGANLVWYFVPPGDFFVALVHGNLHWVAVLTLALVALATYLDLAFLRRLFCKEFCPYGRFQTVLVDPGTLTLHYHPDEAPRCIQCGACVRACPTGIDIRRGYQIECINCGRCLDACREVMARRGQGGIIRYTFGLEGRGLAALLNLRMALVALALLGVTAGLILAATQRDLVSLKVGRNPQLLPRLADRQRVANFFTAHVTNRTDEPLTLRLELEEQEHVTLEGPTGRQRLAPEEKRQLDFVVFAAADSLAQPRQIVIMAVDASGHPLSRTTLYLTKPMTK